MRRRGWTQNSSPRYDALGGNWGLTHEIKIWCLYFTFLIRMQACMLCENQWVYAAVGYGSVCPVRHVKIIGQTLFMRIFYRVFGLLLPHQNLGCSDSSCLSCFSVSGSGYETSLSEINILALCSPLFTWSYQMHEQQFPLPRYCGIGDLHCHNTRVKPRIISVVTLGLNLELSVS